MIYKIIFNNNSKCILSIIIALISNSGNSTFYLFVYTFFIPRQFSIENSTNITTIIINIYRLDNILSLNCLYINSKNIPTTQSL